MTNFETFTKVLTKQYKDLYATDPEYVYSATVITPELLANKMAKALRIDAANKDGKGIQRTCKELGIKNTYTAIRAFLNETS